MDNKAYRSDQSQETTTEPDAPATPDTGDSNSARRSPVEEIETVSEKVAHKLTNGGTGNNSNNVAKDSKVSHMNGHAVKGQTECKRCDGKGTVILDVGELRKRKLYHTCFL